MVPVDILASDHVALFGLGGSGLITAKALVAGGVRVTAFDDNPASVESAREQGIETGNLRDLDWTTLSALVLAPGVPLTPSANRIGRWNWRIVPGVEIIGDIELFSRLFDRPDCKASFVAITGTNGKSTTTALIAHVLSSSGRNVQMGGNIGRAVLDLDPIQPQQANQVYVVECSSYQIDLAPLSCVLISGSC